MSRSYLFHKITRASKMISLFGNKAQFNTSTLQNGAFAKWNAPLRQQLLDRVKELKFKDKYPSSRRSEFLEWNYDAELFAFGKRLNEEFDDNLLREALKDHHYVFQQNKMSKNSEIEPEMKNNKELAAAGEALIENFCKKYLRTVWPTLPEEGVIEVTSYLCSIPVLEEVGHGIGLKDIILSVEYPPNPETYATSVCAIISALNVSSGEERCNLFIRDFIITQLVGKDLWDVWEIEKPFELLKEICAQNGLNPPEPRIIGELGKNTLEAVYNIGIYVNKEFLGSGYGESPQIGLTTASLDVLSRIIGSTLSADPLPFNQDIKNLRLKSTPNPSLMKLKIPLAAV